MLPIAFQEKIKHMLEEEERDAFFQSYEEEKYQALRLNPWKQRQDCGIYHSPDGTMDRVSDTVTQWELRQVPWTKHGFYYDEAKVRPGKHPYHEAGLYYIQEPSAMVPGECLDVEPGMRVLDLCAAPGGKSTQIAGKLMGQGMLVSNEPMGNRAKILSENIERLGYPNVVVTNAYPQDLVGKFPAFFHRIMVDAPCSGEGMFRKNELAKQEWSPENVNLCHQRQMEILEAAATMLAPGGQMVYSTCTFSPEENEGTVYAFLLEHPEFHLVEPRKVEGMSDGNPQYLALCGYDTVRQDLAEELKKTLRLWPHKIQGEGHYTAVLEKDGTMPEWMAAPKKKRKPMKNPALEEFLHENVLPVDGRESILQDLLYKNIKAQKDQIYLLPDGCPDLSGIKVLRPGLHIGTMKKDRFEPAHALALALHPEEYKWVVDRTVEEAMDYINGLTFPMDGEKGWYLITVDGMSLGWGKLAGGIMKNHYPKGLRKDLHR